MIGIDDVKKGLIVRLLKAVDASEFGGIFALDIDGEGNWFDVRDRVVRELIADQRATSEAPAEPAHTPGPAASSACPICGVDHPHGHSDKEIDTYLNFQAQRFGRSGWKFPDRTKTIGWALRDMCAGSPLKFSDSENAFINYNRDFWEVFPLIDGRGIEEQRDQLLAENERLKSLVNNAHTIDFLEGVRLEAAHQVERWGEAHDRGKSAENWFWLVGYLAGKGLRAAITGDREKALHHTISSGAALLNWHKAISTDDTGDCSGDDRDLVELDRFKASFAAPDAPERDAAVIAAAGGAV